jgi:hypothetical protein
MGDAEKAASFAEIMRRLRSRTPEELVLMDAETELAIAEAVLLGEQLVADLEQDSTQDDQEGPTHRLDGC